MIKLHNLKDIKSKEIDCVINYIKEYPEKSSLVLMNPQYYGILPDYKRTFSVISEEFYHHAVENYNMDMILNEERINKLLEIWSFLACDYESGAVFGIIDDMHKKYVIAKTEKNNILFIDEPQNIPYEMIIRFAYPYLKNKELLSESEKDELKKYSHALRHYENYMKENDIVMDSNHIYKDSSGHVYLLPDMLSNKNTFLKNNFDIKNEQDFALINLHYLLDK